MKKYMEMISLLLFFLFIIKLKLKCASNGFSLVLSLEMIIFPSLSILLDAYGAI